VFTIFAFLLTLELLRVCWKISAEGHAVGTFVLFGLRTILLATLITRWEFFLTTATTLGVQLGLHIGQGRISQAQFLNPGAYVQLGVAIGQILYEQWSTSQLTNAFEIALSPLLTAGYFLAWLLFLLAFFAMALIIFMKQIELAFALPTLLLLLPFLAYGKTGWLGQGVLTYVAKMAYVFCMLALIASVVFPIMETATATEPDIRQAWMIVCVALTFLACFIAGPMMARNIMSGVFTLGAGSLANAALLAGQSLSAAKSTVQETTRRVVNTVAPMVSEATGGRVEVPHIPAAPRPQAVTQALREGARHLYG